MEFYTSPSEMEDHSDLHDKRGDGNDDELIFLANALGGKIIHTINGPLIEIQSSLLSDEYHGIFNAGNLHQSALHLLPLLFDNINIRPDDIGRLVFIDTETTGLSGGAGTMAFLVGLGYLIGNEFIIKQYFCPDFDHESAMLSHFHTELNLFPYLVSYNGKCFDIPLLENRSILNRIKPITPTKTHLDLLAPARRLYKASYGDCSLSSLENSVLRFRRLNDIPGGLIPQVYFDFLSSRNPAVIKLVLSHNRFDILSLAGLFFHACNFNSSQSKSAEELCSLGVIHLKSKSYREAEYCLSRAVRFGPQSPSYFKAAMNLGQYYKWHNRWEEAFELYSQILKDDGDPLFFGIEAAKIAEHKLKDFPAALSFVDLALAGSSTNYSTGASSRVFKAIQHRKKRLLKKLSAVK